MPDKTALFESSQALFASIADNVGILDISKNYRPDLILLGQNNILKRNLSNSSNEGKAFIKLDILFD